MPDFSDGKVECEFQALGEVTVVAIRGRLNAARVTDVREALIALPEKGQVKIVLDLSGLEWIDSSGVGALVTLYKMSLAKGGDVKVARLQRQPKEIFRLLRLESAFEIFADVETAVARFNDDK